MYHQMPLAAAAPQKGSITGGRTAEQEAHIQQLVAERDAQARNDKLKKIGIGLLVVAVLGGGAVLLLKR